MTEATSIATIFEDFGLDHAPDGWPPIKQMNLTAAAAELRRLEAQLQKETAARQAAQIEAEALKERLVRADAEKCAAVLAERIAPKAPMQEPVHRLIYPGGGKALFNRLWHLTCNAVATQSGMRVRTDVMPMREMKEFLDHLCVLVDSPPQPVPAPVQELCDLCGDINANPASEADMAVYRGIAARYFKDTAPVQEPIGYLAFRDGKPSWDEDCVCEDDVYPIDADDDRVSVAIYTAPQPDRIAQLEAANTNLFEQGQKMHKRIQELERDCKIGAQEMVKACEEIDNLKAQVSWQKPMAWCQLGLDGKSIAYFDGKPMIMTGHVGNQHHPTPLFTAQPRKAESKEETSLRAVKLSDE